MNVSEIALFGGITVTYRAGTPYVATATATLASPPPNVATNCGVCRKRSNPGGLRRSIISPNVTTGFVIVECDVKSRFYQAALLHCPPCKLVDTSCVAGCREWGFAGSFRNRPRRW